MPTNPTIARKGVTPTAIGFTISPALEKIAAEYIKAIGPGEVSRGLVGGICCNAAPLGRSGSKTGPK